MEKVVLVTLNDDNKEELVSLVEAANGCVVYTFHQNLKTIYSKTYIGSGKVLEIKDYISHNEVDTVVFSSYLSGSQQANLNDLLDIKVIDKVALILDIFAKRASSPLAKAQVKLAQLKYQLPRLVGLKKNLSRLSGGIGSKGPGEQQLELDRRKIQKEITHLKKQIEKYESQRKINRQTKQRSSLPTIALVGYTNAGKSTLFNAMMSQKNKQVLEKDMLFASLDVTSRYCYLDKTHAAILVDTVGFIQDLPHDLFEAFRATLSEIEMADMIIIVVDSTVKEPMNQLDMVKQVIKPYIHQQQVLAIYNKSDLVVDKIMSGFFMSAKNPIHIKRLKNEITHRLDLDN